GPVPHRWGARRHRHRTYSGGRLVVYISERSGGQMSATTGERAAHPCAIATVCCAGRFPGASDVSAFWKNLCDGIESIRTFADGELQASFAPEVRAASEFVRARS